MPGVHFACFPEIAECGNANSMENAEMPETVNARNRKYQKPRMRKCQKPKMLERQYNTEVTPSLVLSNPN